MPCQIHSAGHFFAKYTIIEAERQCEYLFEIHMLVQELAELLMKPSKSLRCV